MTIRYIPVLAAFACLSVVGAPAFATDEPPPPAPPTDVAPATDTPQDQPAPAGCVDTSRPITSVKSNSSVVSRTRMLRGTAVDTGCAPGGKVALVSVSIALKQGKQCKYVTRSARLGPKSKCSTPRFLSAKGTTKWQLKLPKRLPKGSYQVLTRAVDSAGNVERAHARRLAIRQPHSSTKK